MKIETYKGYELHLPESGGKAGKGRNQTSSIQVRLHSTIMKQFRFKTDHAKYYHKALAKAKRYVRDRYMAF